MQSFTDYGQNAINNLAQRYGVSNDAVISLLYAVMNGNGTMAQFNHPELGGGGQWMQGGMTMVGDMFNYGLKAKVDGLCTELSNLLSSQQPAVFIPAQPQSQGNRNWWPDGLGMAATTGGQNNSRYAYFPASCRLAVDINGQLTVYDTLDHQIGGVSQQQGGNNSMTFSSQYGTVQVEQLPVISVNGIASSTPVPAPAPMQSSGQAVAATDGYVSHTTAANGDIFTLIERLADLKQKGILSEEEFANKKAELLQRL